jgi:gamma-glutamyltranspeptidase/glutathione hydrolase
MMRTMWSVLILACCIAPAAWADVARSRGGMVVTINPIATDAGVAVMQQGGNAIDAAVAAALMLGVVDSSNSGIGGGCFILIRSADGEITAIDGRETAPAKASRDMYLRNGVPTTQLSQVGALASGVPGCLLAYEHVVGKFGKKKLGELFAPAADVAEKGFAVDAPFVKRVDEEVSQIKQFPETAKILLKPDGSKYALGETLRRADLAKTYRSLAENGTGWFYRGPFAQAVDAWMKTNGGILSAEDFASYQIKLREPLRTTHGGYTIVGFPPPSSGGVHVAQILNILKYFDVKQLHERNPADRVHVIAEAMKLAFADRAYWLGDPDFVKVPRGLLDADYAAGLAKKIDLKHATQFEHGVPPRADDDVFGKHTTHIAAADSAGNWIGITTTLNTAFGSKVIVPGTGVLLNNQMDDFSIAPGEANFFKLVGSEANAIAPGKRPLSSMSPTIVMKDGEPMMTVGAAGGPTIISKVVLVLSNVLDLGDDLPTAMSRPRFHHQWSPDKLVIEKTFPEDVLNDLKQRGHVLEMMKPIGAANAIVHEGDGTFVGVSEPRARGKAAGVSP